MSRLWIVVAFFALAVHADEQTVNSQVESVGLFKNGLAVVSRTVELPGPGTFKIEDVPTPVHGTFFIESSTTIVARSTMQLVDVPMDLSEDPLQDQLAGKTVRVSIKDTREPIVGKVADLSAAKQPNWDRNYEQPRYPNYYYGRPAPVGNSSRFLIVDAPERMLIDQSTITSIRIEGDGATTIKKRKPVLLLTTGDANAPKQTVRISYLTNGLAWAPSYRVDLLDDKQLAIEQTAIVKNELLDLKDVEVHLISGYPSISFSHVTSPLSLEQKWSSFFQQLAQGSPRRGGSPVYQQQIVSNAARADEGASTGVLPADESIDIHYQPIGKQSLSEGDAMSLSIASGKSDYERIVEWTIPDNRDAYGRFIDQYQRQQFPDKFEDAAWDAVKFKNPLSFPMTTAPAMFLRDGKFLGQQTSTWVNAGESTTLRITKALSIRTSSREQEDAQKEREIVWVAGNDFRKVSVKGTLSAENFRKTDAKIIVKRQFSGELVKADENPRVTLREEGVWSVNPRNEMEWTITLKPGEKKTLEYAYTVLVDN